MPFRVAYSWPLCSHVMSSTKPELPILLTIGFSHYLPTSIHTHTHPFNGPFFPGLPGWAGTRKVRPIWISLKQETVSGSGISWAISKSAPHSRQMTTPAPDHSVFLQAGCPSYRSTASQHWRPIVLILVITIHCSPYHGFVDIRPCLLYGVAPWWVTLSKRRPYFRRLCLAEAIMGKYDVVHQTGSLDYITYCKSLAQQDQYTATDIRTENSVQIFDQWWFLQYASGPTDRQALNVPRCQVY